MRGTVRRSLAGALAAGALCLGWLTPVGGVAAADDGSLLVDVPGDGVGFSHEAAGPLLDVPRLYPGGSGEGTVEVRNTSAYDTDLVLLASGIDSQENDCVRPESREPEEGCDADGGELDDWLDVTVSQVSDVDQVLWEGNLASLTAGADLGALPAGATSRLRVRVTLPQAAGNETMTDSVGFDTRFTATSVAGQSTVGGPQVDLMGGTPAPAGPGLSFLGDAVPLWLVLDALVLVAGASVFLAHQGRRRRGYG